MRRFPLVAALLATAGPSVASETINYTYDARGRLTQVAHAGTVNDGLITSYTLDKADNRLSVSGSASPPPGPPSFSVSDVAVIEGIGLVFTITKTGSATSSFSVNYATANGSAVAASDYTAASGTLTFASADTSKTVTIATIDDAVTESAEQMNLNLSAATGGATISDALGVGTINDNDSPPPGVSFSINDVSVTEGGNLLFTVTKTGSTSSSFSVNYATANGTASTNDYTAKSGTLTFTSTQTSQTISVVTKTDILTGEEDETVLVNLSGATTGATITDSQGVGTIINDCGSPSSC